MGSWRGSTVRDEGCGAERGQVGLERIVVFVAHRHGENAGGGRAHERLDEGAGHLVEYGSEIAALLVDGAIVEIAMAAFAKSWRREAP